MLFSPYAEDGVGQAGDGSEAVGSHLPGCADAGVPARPRGPCGDGFRENRGPTPPPAGPGGRVLRAGPRPVLAGLLRGGDAQSRRGAVVVRGVGTVVEDGDQGGAVERENPPRCRAGPGPARGPG